MCESVPMSVWTQKGTIWPIISAVGQAVGAERMGGPRFPFHGLWTLCPTKARVLTAVG